jgi:hypothetical protein
MSTVAVIAHGRKRPAGVGRRVKVKLDRKVLYELDGGTRTSRNGDGTA